MKQKREEKKASEAREMAAIAFIQARQQKASSAAALADISNSSAKPAPTAEEPAKGEEVAPTGDNVEGNVDENPQKKARLESTE